ncbi:HAD family hydrolase [Pseudomonas syringae]|uniref:HAD family hydrolase n=1 Tax=Pseudomonas syringae TaxID=317 RepID=UPI00070DEBBE|nr:HAD family hydrolase [Pseudomonas syringae]KWS40876.1 haloacid dehalogenase [Pseudomonas syringae pv. rhaphiolepidis]
MSASFILFDAFGTLLNIPEGRHPYRQILKEGIRQGRRPQPNDLRQILTRNLGLSEAAEVFGIKIDDQLMTDIAGDLAADIASITPFDDGLRAVERLRSEDVRVAIASNLAAPYGSAVRRLYPLMDAFGFSYSLGSMKPEPFLYRSTCELMGASTDAIDSAQVLMVGDSKQCDRDGPGVIGINGFLLARDGRGEFSDLTQFADFALRIFQQPPSAD